MANRMNEETWGAVFMALSRGIDQIEEELLHADPDDVATYGAIERRHELAQAGYRILLHRRYKA